MTCVVLTHLIPLCRSLFSSSGRGAFLAKTAAIFCVCIFVYAPQLNNSFLCDDYKYLPFDELRAGTGGSPVSAYFKSGEKQHYNPLDKILNVILFRYLPPEPIYFRLVNLVLFFFNAVFFLWLACLLTRSQRTAFTAALFFCLHPLSAEMLNHVSFNSVFVSALFFLMGFVSYIFYEEKGGLLGLGGSLVFFVSAQLALEFSTIFPGVLFLYLFFIKKHTLARSCARLIPFVALAALYGFVWFTMAGTKTRIMDRVFDLGIGVPSYLASLSYLFNWFLLNVVFPEDLVFIFNIYPLTDVFQVRFFLAVMAVELVLLSVAIVFGKKRGIKIFCLLWLAAGFLPAFLTSLSHAYMGMVFEPYWMYVPMMGFFLLLAVFLEEMPQGSFSMRRVLLAGTCAYFFLFGRYYIDIGKTAARYYSNWSAKCPNNYLALCNLAQEHMLRREYDKALEYSERAVRSVTNPTLYPPHIAYLYVGQIYFVQGQDAKAKQAFNDLLKVFPDDPYSFYYLGMIVDKEGDGVLAEGHYRKALHLAPAFPSAALKLSALYERQGRQESAIAALQEAWAAVGRGRHAWPVVLQLVKIYLAVQKYPETFLLLEDLTRRGEDKEIYWQILNVINEEKAYGLGLEILNGLAPLLGQNNAFYLLKGIFYANLGRYREAIEIWEQGRSYDHRDGRFPEHIDKAVKLMGEQGEKVSP